MQAQPFDGVPYVGAVFSSQNGKPANHFATAFVVTSKSGDILMSAAHILLNRNAADLLFLPGYTQGRAPHGVWPIQASYVTAAWQKQQNIDDDFCFLKVNADVQRQGFVKVGVAVRDLWDGLTRPSGGVPGVPGQPYLLL